MITESEDVISWKQGQIKQLKKGEKITWVTQKNIGVEEKWVQKRDELEKEIKENRYLGG